MLSTVFVDIWNAQSKVPKSTANLVTESGLIAAAEQIN